MAAVLLSANSDSIRLLHLLWRVLVWWEFPNPYGLTGAAADRKHRKVQQFSVQGRVRSAMFEESLERVDDHADLPGLGPKQVARG
ncbi:MAG: hypothetical protein M2R45_00464 [Verrucomicrobia subdivision 3 bacterium]|nr:hypothetical protein [Limisphaerales bacterium]MCS1413656.1 hypothetical protein [Limisphaerales bacterium]